MSIFRTITTLLLAALFAVATTGVSVVYHYCADRLDSVALFAGGKVCGCTGEQSQSCCRDEVALHKLDLNCKLHAPLPSVQHIAMLVLPVAEHVVTVPYDTDSEVYIPVDTSPPGTTDIPIATQSLLI